MVLFPQAKGKVIRSIRFLQDDSEKVLTINFSDRSALTFDINPVPLVLPIRIAADYSDWSSGNRRAIGKWDDRSDGS
jgi:hypothetical protein